MTYDTHHKLLEIILDISHGRHKIHLTSLADTGIRNPLTLA